MAPMMETCALNETPFEKRLHIIMCRFSKLVGFRWSANKQLFISHYYLMHQFNNMQQVIFIHHT